jgi:chromosome segregation ATPase
MFEPTITMPARADSPTPSIEPQRVQGGLFDNLLRGHTNSKAPSVASIGPTIGDLQKENDALRKEKSILHSRCEELKDQSTLNQDMFQFCSKDLLTKDAEIRELGDVITEHERIISGLKACIRKETDIHAQDKEQVVALKVQIDVLATELAKAKDMAEKREELITKVQEQQQKCGELYAAEQQRGKDQVDDFLVVRELERRLEEKDETVAMLRRELQDVGQEWEQTLITCNKKAKAKAEREVHPTA